MKKVLLLLLLVILSGLLYRNYKYYKLANYIDKMNSLDSYDLTYLLNIETTNMHLKLNTLSKVDNKRKFALLKNNLIINESVTNEEKYLVFSDDNLTTYLNEKDSLIEVASKKGASFKANNEILTLLLKAKKVTIHASYFKVILSANKAMKLLEALNLYKDDYKVLKELPIYIYFKDDYITKIVFDFENNVLAPTSFNEFNLTLTFKNYNQPIIIPNILKERIKI